MEELFDFVEFLVSSAGEELTILEIRSSTLSLLHILSLSQPYAGNESQIKKSNKIAKQLATNKIEGLYLFAR